jgi:predicted phage terminase large subunit-like protein
MTMDFAASQRSSADYTVAAVWGISPSGDLILLDRRRNRVPDHDHFAMAEPLRVRWGIEQVFVESNYWSSTFVTDARDNGIAVAPLRADTDKLTRAIPAAGRIHSGRVWFPAVTSGCPCENCRDTGGAWLDEFCDELALFPAGTHDDQVDVLAYAARIQVADWTAPKSPPRPGITPAEHAIAMAAESAVGDGHEGHGDLDLFSIPY